MKNIIFVIVAALIFSACSMKPSTLVGDKREINGGNAELTINGDSGHLLIQYNPSVQWPPINEEVKILKHDSYEIEIQRPDGVKLHFVGGRLNEPYVCDNCKILYNNKIPVIWYQK